MKFSKLLIANGPQSVGPEMESMFLKYKELKKLIKAIPKADEGIEGHEHSAAAEGAAQGPGAVGSTATSDAAQPAAQQPQQEAAGAPGRAQPQQPPAPPMHQPLSADEARFIATLNEEVQKFNTFFEDAEEDAVIMLQALSDELQAWITANNGSSAAGASSTGDGAAAAAAPEAHARLQRLQARIVELHGQCVLHLHWSLLNYGAIAKILKKHDKRTGIMLRAPYLANVLAQPFNSTSIMSRLVKAAEELLEKARAALPRAPQADASGSAGMRQDGNATAGSVQGAGADGVAAAV
eukprot:CAMPEP_0202861658 /NCGR_PEP_ID=MMETSP1391-20130828/2984_1 /ASSEMBLY_ACC=CAM_ASM_000867 /TAXON_ID=1034604 /ORGANISM="Chlamydomonas leiostraca, Strain SAG 11-49" /LENGTH=294 /DNA_ID=CAMNT_0049541079 /DNA_START=169 /DNA_END=1049 /DNA_ORIENTATION=+